jgi:uncharacterized membrane protein
VTRPATRAALSSHRKGYLDWLRGVGVLIMIQGHVVQSWTRVADRDHGLYRAVVFVGGIGAPIFLFLAGVALALAAGAQLRKGRTVSEAARRARSRGWQVFGLAFLFRLQSWLISGGPPGSLLKVDILNILGLSMVAAAVMWGFGRERWSRTIVLSAAALVVAMVTPLVRAAGVFDIVPDVVERYIRPLGGATNFSLFPWAAFVLAGGAVGLWLDSAATARRERLANVTLGVIGSMVALAGYVASFLPPIYPETSFWTSSPTFFFVRLGILLMLLPAAYAWNSSSTAWYPLRDFGRASLFVYWIHVEMAYGVISLPLHQGMSVTHAYAGFVVLSALLFGLVKLKEKAARRYLTPYPGAL